MDVRCMCGMQHIAKFYVPDINAYKHQHAGAITKATLMFDLAHLCNSCWRMHVVMWVMHYGVRLQGRGTRAAMDLHSCGLRLCVELLRPRTCKRKGIAKAQEMHVSPVSMHWPARFDQLVAVSTAALVLLCCPAADSVPSEQLPTALT